MTPMALWDDIKRIFRREAADVKEGLTTFGREVDAELARKERELNATPAERVDMLIEDMDAAESHMDEIEAKVRGGIAGRDETTTPSPPPQPKPRVQILEAKDVSAAPHFAVALEWVSVNDFDDEHPLRHRFDHDVWIEEWVGPIAGDDVLDRVAYKVADHPLVEEALREDREVLYVRAPQLHHEDVRLLVAAAFADHVPDDWKQHLDG